MTTAQTIVELEDVTKTYQQGVSEVHAVDHLSFTVDSGEFVALAGPSGSGKTTCLNLIGGLDTPDRGKIAIDGTDLTGLNDPGRAALRRSTVAVVFQQFNLIPSLTVAANIAFQAELAGRRDTAWTDELTDRLGLTSERGKYPEQLSGGQQQRVAIGRALATRPALLLADEPTGNLDEATGDTVLDLMFELTRETGAALLMVTHSERLAARLSRRLHLSGGRLT